MNEQLKTMIEESSRIVFFGGAGVSTESNIPDFRSSGGIYQQKKYPYPAEVMLSSDFFYDHTRAFYDFYFHEMIYPDARPNPAHLALAALERAGKLKAVITQNIDGLHQQAGSKEVLELHGSVNRNRCLNCHAFMDLDTLMAHRDEQGIPALRGMRRPDEAGGGPVWRRAGYGSHAAFRGSYRKRGPAHRRRDLAGRLPGCWSAALFPRFPSGADQS